MERVFCGLFKGFTDLRAELFTAEQWPATKKGESVLMEPEDQCGNGFWVNSILETLALFLVQ